MKVHSIKLNRKLLISTVASLNTRLLFKKKVPFTLKDAAIWKNIISCCMKEILVCDSILVACAQQELCFENDTLNPTLGAYPSLNLMLGCWSSLQNFPLGCGPRLVFHASLQPPVLHPAKLSLNLLQSASRVWLFRSGILGIGWIFQPSDVIDAQRRSEHQMHRDHQLKIPVDHKERLQGLMFYFYSFTQNERPLEPPHTLQKREQGDPR